ncbi:MAG: gliding motility-associated protein GldE [Cyclobacteriaceae bacterium]
MDDPFPGIFEIAAILLSLDIYFVSFNIVVLIILFGLSALVSGSEVAYFSISQNQIEEYKHAENVQTRRIAGLLEHPKRLLATILILNNFINIAIVMICTYFTWQVTGTKNTEGIILVILTTIVTIAIVFIGEIVPKIYANQNSVSFAKRTSGLLSVAYAFFKPLSWLLMSLSRVIDKRIQKRGYNVSVDELHHALELTTEEDTTEEEKGILKGIVNFGTLSVKQIMKSRLDITAIEISTDFHELMNQVNKTGFSRLPVYNDSVDKIEGILYIKDLLPHLNEDENFNWQELLRPGFYVPETKKIDTLFNDFQEKRVHIAIVVDEYGGTSGLITLEDVIEEIVGEINDEFDEGSDIPYNKLDNNTFIFDGKTSLMDFCKITGIEHSTFDEAKGESESVGGLLLELNSKLPNSGEKIHFENFVFTVVAVNDKRIKRVRVYIRDN